MPMVAGQYEEDNMEAVIAAAKEQGIDWDTLSDEEKATLYRDYTGEELVLDDAMALANAGMGGTQAGNVFVADSAGEAFASLGTAYMTGKKKKELSKQKAQARELAGGVAAYDRNQQNQLVRDVLTQRGQQNTGTQQAAAGQQAQAQAQQAPPAGPPPQAPPAGPPPQAPPAGPPQMPAGPAPGQTPKQNVGAEMTQRIRSGVGGAMDGGMDALSSLFRGQAEGGPGLGPTDEEKEKRQRMLAMMMRGGR